LFDQTYQRYLMNTFREKLPFGNVPIKLYLRARTRTEPGQGPSKPEPVEPPSITEQPSGHGFNLDDLDAEVNQLLGDADDSQG